MLRFTRLSFVGGRFRKGLKAKIHTFKGKQLFHIIYLITLLHRRQKFIHTINSVPFLRCELHANSTCLPHQPKEKCQLKAHNIPPTSLCPLQIFRCRFQISPPNCQSKENILATLTSLPFDSTKLILTSDHPSYAYLQPHTSLLAPCTINYS